MPAKNQQSNDNKLTSLPSALSAGLVSLHSDENYCYFSFIDLFGHHFATVGLVADPTK